MSDRLPVTPVDPCGVGCAECAHRGWVLAAAPGALAALPTVQSMLQGNAIRVRTVAHMPEGMVAAVACLRCTSPEVRLPLRRPALPGEARP